MGIEDDPRLQAILAELRSRVAARDRWAEEPREYPLPVYLVPETEVRASGVDTRDMLVCLECRVEVDVNAYFQPVGYTLCWHAEAWVAETNEWVRGVEEFLSRVQVSSPPLMYGERV